MKILIACTWYVPQVLGGSETRINTICKELSLEHEVKVFCRNKDSGGRIDHIGPIEVMRQSYALPGSRFLRKPLEYRQDYHNGLKIDYDFDLCLSTSFGYSMAIKKKYPDKNMKFLVTALVNYLDDANEPGIGFQEGLCRRFDRVVNGYMEKKALCLADKLIVSSRPVHDSIIKEYGIEQSKMKLLPQAIDLSRFSGKRDRRILDELGVDKDKFIILAVSSLSPRKNLPLLVKAMKYVGDDSICIIVGEGDKRGSLEKLARDEKVDKKIIFAGEVLDVERYYSAADIFAHPASYEPFGNALIEALAFGLPCVGLKLDMQAGIFVANDEIITDDVGFRVRKEEKEFADAIMRLKNDKTLRQNMSENARNEVKRKYFVGKYVKDILAV